MENDTNGVIFRQVSSGVPEWTSCSPGAGGVLPGKQQALLRLCSPTQRCHLQSTQMEGEPGVLQAHSSASDEVLQALKKAYVGRTMQVSAYYSGEFELAP